MTSASIRDPVADHLVTPQNAALAGRKSRPFPRDYGHPS
jgi:hypothetical protein